MSGGSARRAEPPAAAQVLSYVEESCYVGEQERDFKLPVTFRLFSIGHGLGCRVDTSFVADYGLYYGDDDERLIQLLQHACPSVNWVWNKVYHRWLDQSRIQVLNAATGAPIAQVEVRRYMGRRVPAASVEQGDYGDNVVTLSQLRAARAARLAAHQMEEDPDVREEDLLVTAENTLTVGTARVRLRVTLEVTDPATEEVG